MPEKKLKTNEEVLGRWRTRRSLWWPPIYTPRQQLHVIQAALKRTWRLQNRPSTAKDKERATLSRVKGQSHRWDPNPPPVRARKWEGGTEGGGGKLHTHSTLTLQMSPSALLLAVSHRFYSVCYNFSYIHFNVFFISLETSLIDGLFSSMLFNFEVLQCFPVIFLLFISSLFPLWWEHLLYDMDYYKCVELLYDLRYCQCSWMFHVCLKIICILILLDAIL